MCGIIITEFVTEIKQKLNNLWLRCQSHQILSLHEQAQDVTVQMSSGVSEG